MKSMLAAFAMALAVGPVLAQPPGMVGQAQQPSPLRLEQHMRQMGEVMQRMQTTQDPAERQRLRRQHNELMQQGMEMELQAMKNCPGMSQENMAMMQMMMDHMQQHEAMMGPGGMRGGVMEPGGGYSAPPGGTSGNRQ
ncbi:MAG TPA: hypothetical protein VFY81_11820 [Gammaproteobacteria bacterium]|nr:hypothetical protein [Gammaproteobacteria bacterium]